MPGLKKSSLRFYWGLLSGAGAAAHVNDLVRLKWPYLTLDILCDQSETCQSPRSTKQLINMDKNTEPHAVPVFKSTHGRTKERLTSPTCLLHELA